MTHHSADRYNIAADLMGDRSVMLLIDVPSSIDVAVRELLSATLWFLPRSVRELSVRYEADDTESLAKICTSDQYRRGSLVLTPGFIALSHPEQLETMLHEIAHLWFCRLSDDARQLVRDSFEDGSVVCTLAHGIVERATESCTEDLARFFFELGKRATPDAVMIPRRGAGQQGGQQT